MTPSQLAQRQAFEEWARTRHLRLQMHRGTYVSEVTRTCWELWLHLRDRSALL